MSRTRCSRHLFAILARTLVDKALAFVQAHPPATVTTVASVGSVFRTVPARARNTVKTGTLVGYVTTTTKMIHECIAMFSCMSAQRPLAILNAHTYIHTYIQTDRQTDIHIYIHLELDLSNIAGCRHRLLLEEHHRL